MKTIALAHLPSAQLQPLSASNADALIANAWLLHRAAEPPRTLLRGKRLALLCESQEGADAVLFREAAGGLGAQVSHVRSRLADLHEAGELHHTARLLGRLYDGIECQGVAHELVELVGREAGVPAYDGLASDNHPTARLAALLDVPEPRRLVLQTVLLSTLQEAS